MTNLARIFKTKTFLRWQKKALISDSQLIEAIQEIQKGSIDADLGSGLIKKRIARSGSGKSSGFRTLVATNNTDKWFFVFGFAKNEKDNIEAGFLSFLKKFSKLLLVKNAAELNKMLVTRELMEITDAK